MTDLSDYFAQNAYNGEKDTDPWVKWMPLGVAYAGIVESSKLIPDKDFETKEKKGEQLLIKLRLSRDTVAQDKRGNPIQYTAGTVVNLPISAGPPTFALMEAIAKGAPDRPKRMEDGAQFAMQFSSEKDVGKGDPQKQFTAAYRPPARGVDLPPANVAATVAATPPAGLLDAMAPAAPTAPAVPVAPTAPAAPVAPVPAAGDSLMDMIG